MKTWPGGLPVGKLGDLLAMFSSKSGRGEFICFYLFFGPIRVHIYILFFKSCLMLPKLRLKTESKKAERVQAENQYFLYSTLIRIAMVEAYCPTLVELVFIEWRSAFPDRTTREFRIL
jgi:hypothetical protein